MVTWWHGDMRAALRLIFHEFQWGGRCCCWQDEMTEWAGQVHRGQSGGERLHDRWRHLDGSKSDVSHVSSVKYSRQCWAAQCPMSAERCRKLRGSSHHGTLFIAASKILGASTGLARDIIKTCQELPSNVSERNSFLKISHPSSSPVLVSFFLWTKAEEIKIQDTKSVAFNLNFVVICSLHGALCQGKTKRHQHHYIRNCWSKDDCLSPCVQVYRCTVLYNTPTAWLTQLYNRRLSARVLAGTSPQLRCCEEQNSRLNIFRIENWTFSRFYAFPGNLTSRGSLIERLVPSVSPV